MSADLPILPHPSAAAAWAARVAASGAATAYRHKSAGRWLDVSWGTADELAGEIAAGFVAVGLAPGDRVGILAETRFEWMCCDVAGQLAALVPVPVYPSSTAAQAAHILRDCGARLVVVDNAAQLDKVLPLLLSGMDVKLVHIDDDGRAEGGREVKLADVLARVPREAREHIFALDELRTRGRAVAARPDGAVELARRRAAAGPDDPFTIIYTSGTTGTPKGVVLTQRNLLAACASAVRALTLELDDLHFLWLTLAHVFAREVIWASLLKGLTVVFAEGVPKLKENLLEVRPTFMAGVPRVYEKFAAGIKLAMGKGHPLRRRLVAWGFTVGNQHARRLRSGQVPGRALALRHRLADRLVLARLRRTLGLDRCRFLISGGAPLAAEVAEFFHAIGLLVLEGYGLTETTAAAFVNRADRFRFGTVGPALDVVECRIAADGEILLRGPSIFTRYHGDARATAEAIDGDGFFHTGDIGVFEDGFLRITDRKKDLIVLAGGKKVAPQVLELALKARSPLVSHALVYGDRRSYVVALVTVSDEAVKTYGPDAAARAEVRAAVGKAIAEVNEGLAPFEKIRGFALLGEDFTEANGLLTPSLKVKRKPAIDRHWGVIEGLYSGG